MQTELFNEEKMEPQISAPAAVPTVDYEEDYNPRKTGFPIRDRDLPPIISQVVSNSPHNRKIPAFVACLAPLCALATRIRLHYHYDGQRESGLLLQVLIEGSQSVGKSFAADIERLIMNDTLKAHDKVQRRLEQKYREKKKTRKANEKLEEEPKTTIRVIPPTVSKTVLTRRADAFDLVYGSSLTFWMFAEELAQVTDAGKQGYSNLRTIMRTAYDWGSLFGLDFASDNSYSAIVDINICSMFCTTPAALDKYMDRDSIEGGNMSRCIRCFIDDEIGADGAIFKPYTDEQMSIINTTLKRMMDDCYSDNGGLRSEIHLHLPWLNRMARQWCQQKGCEAGLNGRKCYEDFRKRSSVSAYRTAALCYYLYGLDEGIDWRMENAEASDKAKRLCKQIYQYMAEYIFQGLVTRWGKEYDNLNAKRKEKQSGGRMPGLFDLCPDTFSREQLKVLAEQQGCTTDCRQFIYLWKQNGYIAPIDKNHFRKVNTK